MTENCSIECRYCGQRADWAQDGRKGWDDTIQYRTQPHTQRSVTTLLSLHWWCYTKHKAYKYVTGQLINVSISYLMVNLFEAFPVPGNIYKRRRTASENENPSLGASYHHCHYCHCFLSNVKLLCPLYERLHCITFLRWKVWFTPHLYQLHVAANLLR